VREVGLTGPFQLDNLREQPFALGLPRGQLRDDRRQSSEASLMPGGQPAF
jgi:hypothetical protein